MNFNLHISEIVTTSKVGDVNFLCYDDLPEMTDEQKFLDDIRSTDYPCTMIFTSGSTGKPKGVILSAYNIRRLDNFHSVPTMLIALINNKNFSADKLSTLRCTIISSAAVKILCQAKSKRSSLSLI